MTDTAVVPVAASAPANPLGCPPPEPRDVELPSFDTLNRISRALTARYTQGISPHAAVQRLVRLAFASVAGAGPPARADALAQIYAARLAGLALHDGASPALPFEPQPGDRRFDDPGWRKAPYQLFRAGLPGAGGVVARGDQACARHAAEGRRPRRLHGAAVARRGIAVERALAQSADRRAHARRARRQSGARLREPARGLAARRHRRRRHRRRRASSSARTSPSRPARSSTATT